MNVSVVIQSGNSATGSIPAISGLVAIERGLPKLKFWHWKERFEFKLDVPKSV